MTRILSRWRRAGAALLAAVALAGGVAASGIAAQPARAAGQVTVTGEPTVEGESSLQLAGSGFQSVQNGFGGIYVLFGWVDDPNGTSWRPSQGGVTGEDYRYVYDDESKPAGFQLFVTFPGSSTAYAANGGQVNPDGTWAATIRVPGAVFQTYDRQQNVATVDCREVTCGIITIGAHGVKNANNESFTPVTFAAAAAAAAPSAEAAPQGAPAEGQTQTAPGQGTAPVATSQPVAAQPQAQAAASPGSTLPDWVLVLMPLLILIGFSILVISVGVGAYLAAKSLLLGVSPAALEKVRGERDRKALRERDRQERKTAQARRQHDLRIARDRQRGATPPYREGLLGADAPGRARPASGQEGPMIDFFRPDADGPTGAPEEAGPRTGATASGELADRGLLEDALTLQLSSARGHDGGAR